MEINIQQLLDKSFGAMSDPSIGQSIRAYIDRLQNRIDCVDKAQVENYKNLKKKVDWLESKVIEQGLIQDQLNVIVNQMHEGEKYQEEPSPLEDILEEQLEDIIDEQWISCDFPPSKTCDLLLSNCGNVIFGRYDNSPLAWDRGFYAGAYSSFRVKPTHYMHLPKPKRK